MIGRHRRSPGTGPEPLARPGDTVTITGTVRRVWGPRGGKAALVETAVGGVFSIPLSPDGLLPDPDVEVGPIKGRRCTSCGR